MRYREGFAGAIRGTVLYPFIAIQRGAVDREGRFADAGAVRAERDSLAAFLVGQANLAAENRRLRGLLGMRERLPNSFVAAEVMPFEGAAAPGTFMITAGSEDAVQPGSAIVTAQGLVGAVRAVYRGYSIAGNWTNPDFRASAVSEDGETYGILAPHSGRRGGEQLLALTSTALHTVPKLGTVIVTSGSGATYPRGIPIGTVVDTASEASGWQRIYLIRPFVSPAEMSHVLVLGAPKAGATDRDLAAAWGIRLREGPAPDSLMLPVAPAAAPAPRPAGGQPRPQPRRPQGPRLLGTPVERPQETQSAAPPAQPPAAPQTPPDTSRTRNR